MADQNTTGGAQAAAPNDEDQDLSQGAGKDEVLEGALKRGEKERQEGEEAGEKLRTDRQEEEKVGAIGRVFAVLKMILSMPFMIAAHAARTVMGKITGEDIAGRVREARREMKETGEAQDHLEGRMAERLKERQEQLAGMHMEHSRMTDDLEAKKEAVDRERQDLEASKAEIGQGGAPSAQVVDGNSVKGLNAPAEGSPKMGPVASEAQGHSLAGLMEASRSNVEPVSEPKAGARTWSDEDNAFLGGMGVLMEAIEPSYVSQDIVSRGAWLAWESAGAQSEDIREKIRSQFGDDWEAALAVPYGGSERPGKAAVAAMFEIQCAANSDLLRNAAKQSAETFDKALLQQMAMVNIGIAGDEKERQNSAEAVNAAVGGEWGGVTEIATPAYRESINAGIEENNVDLRHLLHGWQGKTSIERGVSIDGMAGAAASREEASKWHREDEEVVVLPKVFTDERPSTSHPETKPEAEHDPKPDSEPDHEKGKVVAVAEDVAWGDAPASASDAPKM